MMVCDCAAKRLLGGVEKSADEDSVKKALYCTLTKWLLLSAGLPAVLQIANQYYNSFSHLILHGSRSEDLPQISDRVL
eukprot:614106-Amphidinium_carterae.1